MRWRPRPHRHLRHFVTIKLVDPVKPKAIRPNGVDQLVTSVTQMSVTYV